MEEAENEIKRRLRKFTSDELETMASTDDVSLFIDRIIDQTQLVGQLNDEKEQLKQEVKNLAYFNHAREPEFARHRRELRESLVEVNQLRRSIVSKHLEPTVGQFEKIKQQLRKDEARLEAESEAMAKDLFDGVTNYSQFRDKNIDKRKQMWRRRVQADKIEKQLAILTNCVTKPFTSDSPKPVPRRRSRRSDVPN